MRLFGLAFLALVSSPHHCSGGGGCGWQDSSVVGRKSRSSCQRQRTGSDRNSYGPAPLHISPNFRFSARSPARVSSLTIRQKKMSFDLYSAHRAAAANQGEELWSRQTRSKIWAYVIGGGIVGIVVYISLVAGFAVTARIGQPSYMPMGAWFIAVSAIPFSWFLKMHWSLLFFAALNWTIAGTVVGAIVGYMKFSAKSDQKGPNQPPKPIPLKRDGSS